MTYPTVIYLFKDVRNKIYRVKVSYSVHIHLWSWQCLIFQTASCSWTRISLQSCPPDSMSNNPRADPPNSTDPPFLLSLQPTLTPAMTVATRPITLSNTNCSNEFLASSPFPNVSLSPHARILTRIASLPDPATLRIFRATASASIFLSLTLSAVPKSTKSTFFIILLTITLWQKCK